MSSQLLAELIGRNTSRLWSYPVIVGIPIFIVGIFIYELGFKETVISTSHSNNPDYYIKVVEKGAAITFGPSAIRIKSNSVFYDTTIFNDGGRLQSRNATIEWKDNHIAIITLSGDEQGLEIIEYNAVEKTFQKISE